MDLIAYHFLLRDKFLILKLIINKHRVILRILKNQQHRKTLSHYTNCIKWKKKHRFPSFKKTHTHHILNPPLWHLSSISYIARVVQRRRRPRVSSAASCPPPRTHPLLSRTLPWTCVLPSSGRDRKLCPERELAESRQKRRRKNTPCFPYWDYLFEFSAIFSMWKKAWKEWRRVGCIFFS